MQKSQLFDPSILRHCEIWGAADEAEAVLKYIKSTMNMKSFPSRVGTLSNKINAQTMAWGETCFDPFNFDLGWNCGLGYWVRQRLTRSLRWSDPAGDLGSGRSTQTSE
jgi:hypothetical protein